MEISGSNKMLLLGALLGTLAPTAAFADNGPNMAPSDESDGRDQIVVTGVRSLSSDKIPDGLKTAPQSIDIISQAVLQQQGASRLQDALRNVPGITLNAGEGSARGDTVNLRGFPAFNDFFLDGIRDAAIYTRDSFNLEAVEVLKGPSAVLFGRGSTGGAINQVSKAPTLAPIYAGTLVGGTNNEIRGTADIDQPLGDTAAIRVNAMGEHSNVADRDYVRNHRWAVAPSVSIGIGGPDTLTTSWLHQEENNLQDTGIPFVNGRPAPVRRANFYGLTSDRATANVDVATIRARHEFSSDVAIANTLRYADYRFLNRVDSAHFGYLGSPGAPTPATDIGTALVGRDAPSSSGVRTNLTNQTDLTAHFTTGPVSHTLVAGTEFGREHDNTIRYANPLGSATETPPTSLLHPDATAFAIPQPGKTRAVTTAYSEAAYIIDTVHIGDHLDVTGGVRFDRFAAHYRPSALIAGVSPASLVPLDHVDHVVSPKGSIVYKFSPNKLAYFSYGTSFDPSAEALSLNAKTANLGPVKAKTFEGGTKFGWFNGRLTTTAAIFRTEIDNAQTTDPDHPATQLVLGGDQRVRGFELGANGYLTDKLEIIAGYTYLDGKTLRSTTPGITGMRLANVARNAVNLWTEYEFTKQIEAGIGGNYLGSRFADFGEQARLPSYVLVNAMASYSPNEHITLQVNGNNLFNKLAWQSSYYASPLENHVIPAPGRTFLFTASVKY